MNWRIQSLGGDWWLVDPVMGGHWLMRVLTSLYWQSLSFGIIGRGWELLELPEESRWLGACPWRPCLVPNSSLFFPFPGFCEMNVSIPRFFHHDGLTYHGPEHSKPNAHGLKSSSYTLQQRWRTDCYSCSQNPHPITKKAGRIDQLKQGTGSLVRW